MNEISILYSVLSCDVSLPQLVNTSFPKQVLDKMNSQIDEHEIEQVEAGERAVCFCWELRDGVQ